MAYRDPEAAKRAYIRWRLANPEKVRAARRRWAKKWAAANPEKKRERDKVRNPMAVSAAQRRYRERHRDRLRDMKAVQRAGVAFSRPRPAVCECCGKPPQGKRPLCLDHDHGTGKFRGWLCDRCNKGIGALGDCVNGVAAAIEYLLRAAGA